MVFVPIPNTVRVELIFRQDNQNVQNVFHVITPNAINAAELDAIQEIFKDWYEVYLSYLQHVSVSLVKYVVTDASEQFGVGKEYPPGLVYQGQGTNSPALPNSVSLAIRWNTGLRGRSYRGRTFHVGMTEFMVVGNEVDALVLAEMLTYYRQLIDSLDASGRQLGVASRFQGGMPRSVGVITPILTVTADRVIDNQRRRLPGRGS